MSSDSSFCILPNNAFTTYVSYGFLCYLILYLFNWVKRLLSRKNFSLESIKLAKRRLPHTCILTVNFGDQSGQSWVAVRRGHNFWNFRP